MDPEVSDGSTQPPSEERAAEKIGTGQIPQEEWRKMTPTQRKTYTRRLKSRPK
jgi:hypothetical protein